VFNLATKGSKKYVFSVCVSGLKNPLKNNRVTGYIAVTGVFVRTKFLNFLITYISFRILLIYMIYVF
jgi:hypothetical protein